MSDFLPGSSKISIISFFGSSHFIVFLFQLLVVFFSPEKVSQIKKKKK